jgi:hypothetical protein
MTREATGSTIREVLCADGEEVLGFLCRAEACTAASGDENPPTMTFRNEQLRCIRVDGMLSATPTVSLALAEHETFSSDQAVSWRKLVLEEREPKAGLRGRLMYEKFTLADSTSRQRLTLYASKELEPHSFVVGSWIPDLKHSDYPDISNTGTVEFLGEFFRPCGPPGQSTTTRYTCIVATSGVTDDVLPYLRRHLSQKMAYMNSGMDGGGVEKLFQGIVEAALAEDAEQLKALNVSPVSTASRMFRNVQLELSLSPTPRWSMLPNLWSCASPGKCGGLAGMFQFLR